MSDDDRFKGQMVEHLRNLADAIENDKVELNNVTKEAKIAHTLPNDKFNNIFCTGHYELKLYLYDPKLNGYEEAQDRVAQDCEVIGYEIIDVL